MWVEIYVLILIIIWEETALRLGLSSRKSRLVRLWSINLWYFYFYLISWSYLWNFICISLENGTLIWNIFQREINSQWTLSIWWRIGLFKLWRWFKLILIIEESLLLGGFHLFLGIKEFSLFGLRRKWPQIIIQQCKGFIEHILRHINLQLGFWII
jgi:hypothetical protein